MKIAIIGTGISGLTAAHLLHPHHEITVLEANDYVGGHTNTIDVVSDGQIYPVDTGFIVFNHKTYPGFTALLDALKVNSRPTTMSFSVKCQESGLEYNGTNLNALFAQRRNVFNTSFLRMIWDILRFNKLGIAMVKDSSTTASQTLGDFLKRQRFSPYFIDHYILPMGAAIWSTARNQMLDFPLLFFLRFFHNHGFLSVNDRPQWRVVANGSREYVNAMVDPFRDRILVNTPVQAIRRHQDHVSILWGEHWKAFDQVVLAVHSDQALRLLGDPSPQEQKVLSAIQYEENVAVLHRDECILPNQKRAWAAWNYHLSRERGKVSVTYNMNMLQGLEAHETFCVTLNDHATIDPKKIIRRIIYHHPIFTLQALAAQREHHTISGMNRTHYCGAYWFNGFHEDGLRSGVRVARVLNQTRPKNLVASA